LASSNLALVVGAARRLKAGDDRPPAQVRGGEGASRHVPGLSLRRPAEKTLQEILQLWTEQNGK
jgi:hypothetical protein